MLMVIGIDVAKAELVVGTRPATERWSVANDEAGICTLTERLVAAAGVDRARGDP
jgi:hypothetical protein